MGDTIKGNYRVTQIATIAAAITLVDAELTAQNARMVALGGAATLIKGTITLYIKAHNVSNQPYTHRVSSSLNCPSLADTATQTAALSVYATAVETESSYTTVDEVEVRMSTIMMN